MRGVNVWQEALISAWDQVWTSFLTILPAVLGAVVVFAIGLILAYWVKRLIMEVLGVLRIEKLSGSLGIEQFLKKADVKLNLAEILGVFAQWLIILVFFLAATDILGLSSVSVVLTQVLSYIPNILAAALIFGAGYYVARLVETLVRGALTSVDHEVAKPVSKLSRFLVILVTFFAAVDQLQIAQGLIATFFQGLTYTIVLIVGLSVGLGAKDLVSKALTDWYQKIKK
ncbi:hypothetical protein A2715_00440 [Candidatus Woesebacteria bacterium RIFCSPHIGHO2_01_FULL_39_32]|uniref:Conserved cytoplasmic membrane protein, CmpX protein n=2 Tax=Candidatus Woeseibacteriota TaxID=1752722 RepID=A0A0G0PZW4_9BACT|nr:MAG: Conserved cytoplasmic membrane protein, CmpX protein [Candidatus Woesebacteria bacterium GW2011_GWA1_39_8]OGM24294.1 MAG: hypothetical protein A2715_00440 [Candidatus Woesebacteria bacterium RIFCSPHIGHO2_01_FULL_39_32]OGM35420.1 MAG: hypothetical protein A3F01_04795 [Candidatus Woesebacteria bacterium RIFCSPHIGHO2_12_FULL_38_11]OGM65365.1 MAG: hypothetical protein A2893_01395 [Candidatus Woesebacteria bacterium RIFCSPLOWO2_01_FULL_39_25]